MYKANREKNSDKTIISDMEIFRHMVKSRYARLSHPKAEAFMEGWMRGGHIGRRKLVLGVLVAENGWEIDDIPATFFEVIDDEMIRSGLPESVVEGL